MSSKPLFGLLLVGCVAGSQDQLAVVPAPTAAAAKAVAPDAQPRPPSPSVSPTKKPDARPPNASAPVGSGTRTKDSAPISPSLMVPGAPGSPDRPLPGAVWPPPEGWSPPPCELQTSTVLVKRGAAFEITARLKNLSKSPLEVEAPDRCPEGPAYFHGLGENYDYYGACAQGACASAPATLRLLVPAGQTVDVATILVDPAGNGCNAPLEPGAYTISFRIPSRNVFCDGLAAQFEKKAPPGKPRRATPSKQCPPQPACGIACPGGNYARDEHGCSTCGCANAPSGIAPNEPGPAPGAK